jgi:hypothetical protein
MSTKFNTTYFPEDIVRDGVGGCCHDFAFALQQRTGWPLLVLWKQPVIDEYTLFFKPWPVHIALRAPNGQAVDVEGPHAIDDLIDLYKALKEGTITWDVYPDLDAYTVAMAGAEYGDVMLPRSHGNEAAEKVIAASPTFLALIDTLR